MATNNKKKNKGSWVSVVQELNRKELHDALLKASVLNHAYGANITNEYAPGFQSIVPERTVTVSQDPIQQRLTTFNDSPFRTDPFGTLATEEMEKIYRAERLLDKTNITGSKRTFNGQEVTDEDKDILHELMTTSMPLTWEEAKEQRGHMSEKDYKAHFDDISQKRNYIAEKYGYTFGDSRKDNKAAYDAIAGTTLKEQAANNKDIQALKKLDFLQPGALGEINLKKHFNDGWQFGDVARTAYDTNRSIGKAILGTAGDAGLGVVKGVARLGEGLGDLVGYTTASVADFFGADEYSERVTKNARKSVVDMITGGADEFLDKYSVLGRTSDNIMEGVGQVGGVVATGGLGELGGLGAAGQTALTYGVMGASSMGSGITEAYNSGATESEAFLFGSIAFVSDTVTEMFFGGLGKSLNIVGLGKGLSSADDMLAKKVSSKISNTILRNAAEWGIKAGAEGAEEVLAGLAQAAGKKLTYMSEKDIKEILADENLLEQFIVGAATSGIAQVGDLSRANRAGKDFITGFTEHDNAVVNKEVENRIAEMEKAGKKLTNKEKADLKATVEEALKKGEVSIDTIEEVLGGEEYTAYKDTIDKENAVIDELSSLYEGEELQTQVEELLKDSKRGELRSKLSEKVSGLLKDSFAIESYNEKARRGQKFEADVSKYDEKQRVTVQKAIESGVLNNTRRAHELVDIIAKISADKGVPFDFANNKKIVELGYAVEGMTVDGLKTGDGKIIINTQSPKYLNSVVGHELTHVLEGTKLYDSLKDTLFDYAKSRKASSNKFANEYMERLYNARQRYKNIDGYKGVDGHENIKMEVVADLVGDYLFTDNNFVNHLSVNNRNVFKKLYDEIKYLVKIATAGSKEARQLEKVKKAFDEAYRANISTKTSNITPALNGNNVDVDTDTESTVRYSLREGDPPKKTQEVYKLMRLKDGEIYPLFIDSTEPLKVGSWYDADSPNLDFLKQMPSGVFLVDAENGTYQSYDEYIQESGEKKRKFPSKAAIEKASAEGKRWVYIEDTKGKQARFDGENRKYWNLGINGSGSVNTYSMRPGYHAGSLPTMRQIGKGKNKDLRDDSFVWTVGEVPADIDYQAEADQNPGKDIPTHIPTDGYYLKATNADKAKSQADRVGWYVAGAYKINRIISDSEARQVIDNWNKGHPDSPVEYDYDRESGMDFDADQMKLVPRQYSLSGKKIINTLTGEEIDSNTYAVLDRLDSGDAVSPDDLANLKEVQEGKEKMYELVQDFISENPEFSDIPLSAVGTYLIESDAREQLRNRIIAERKQEGSFTGIDKNGEDVYNGRVQKDYRLDIVIGLPASGKSSSIVNPLSQFWKSVVIDSDIIKKKLPEFNNGWGASLVHEESSDINMRLLIDTLKTGDNIVLPVVGAKASSIEKYINLAKARDYNIHVHLNELPNGKAIGRMLKRYFNNGRFINPSFAVAYGDKPTEVYEQIKQRSDISGYSRWNNDVEKGQRPAPAEVSENNRVYGQYSAAWRAARGTDAERSIGRSVGRETQETELTPIKEETSSKDGVFFDALVKYSLSDSDGNKLTKEQAEYFKDSKTVDENGNLKTLYHGSRSEAFSTFDLYEGVWLTTDPRYAEVYAGQWHSWRDDIAPVEEQRTDLNGLEPEVYSDPDYRLYKMYADIKNPADIGEIDDILSDGKVRQLAQALGMRYSELKPLADTFAEEPTYMLTRSREFIALAQEHGFDGFKATEKGRETWCAFNSEEQVKLVTNKTPTSNHDIRYSLSQDSDGRKLYPSVKSRFANSKVVDENGNLKVVYHGTASGEFSIFDKSKGSVEGDFGSGFYFSDDEYDVEENYEGGGPDFDNKVARLAEQIADEEDLDYDEAEERARQELYKGSHKFEVYLNIENPAIVGETMLFDSESYLEQYSEEDYEDYDDYIADVEQLVADDIDNIVWEVEKNVDIYDALIGENSFDRIKNVLYEAYYEGGIGIEELKKKINELYLEDENGQLVGNEVTRQIIESLGYDGIIDPTVSTKWNMEIEEGAKHYIVFKPNQIKSVTNQNPTDNPDINRSLSDVGYQRPQYGDLHITSEDVYYEQDIAPTVEQNVVTTKKDVQEAPVKAVEEPVTEMFPDTMDVHEELENLLQRREELDSEFLKAVNEQDMDAYNRINEEYKIVQDRIAEIEAEEAERFDSLTDADVPPIAEAPYPGETTHTATPDPFADRDMYDVGKRNVKAYMYENPEVKPFFQDAALGMLDDLHSGTKGEKLYNDEVYYATGGEKGWSGTKRHTTADIASLLDQWHYTYAEIEKGLNAIIEDNGAENNAVSKRIEFMLHDRLVNGYTGVWGEPFPPDQGYINLLNEKQITEYSKEAFDRFMETADQYVPPVEDIAPMPKQVAPALEDAPMREYEAIRPKQKKQPRLVRVDAPVAEQQTANVLDTEPETERRKYGAWAKFVANFADKGNVFETLSLKTKNRELQAKYNSLHYADSKAQRLMGEGAQGVKSLVSIMEGVEKTGKTKQFYEYLYHKHNVDRMQLANRYKDVPNKPVFGDSVTAEKSQTILEQIELKNPAFKKYANDVYAYMNHLRQALVDGGVISQETADLWAEMYPHYVPIRRAGDTGLNINVPLDTNKTGVNAPIKKATGGSRDILPLFDTMAQRTLQTYKAIAKNRFGVELKNTLGTTIANEVTDIDGIIDSVDTQDSLLQEGKNGNSPTFTVFENGEKVTFEITKEMYDALKPTSEGLAYTNKILNTASNIHRGVLTEYNPTFMLTNAIKDAQDILVNSQHPVQTYKNLPKAVTEIVKKGDWYNEYLENGGEQNTYFDKQTNAFEKEKSEVRKIVGMPLDVISKLNNGVEMMPRLAEYIASREAGRSVDVAMLDAARVTTNFAAGGDVTKFLNRNGATFLNASVQGAMQQVRNVREAKMNGLKGWVGLAAKFAAAGLPALLLNGLLWGDDDEYEELSDYVKQNYYVVAKYGDGKFVRIPKGRTMAVIQNAFEQISNAATGNDEVDFKSFVELAISNLAPNNPLDNNIIAPIIQASKNKTWFGDDLVPTRLQDLPAPEQYDETTDAISKWLGEKLNYSPMKINYLLDQYTGGVGDTFLPMMTPAAERGDDSLIGNVLAPLKDKFTTDSVLKNQNISDFYDKMDELTTNAKARTATDEDVLMYKYLNSVNAELGELYTQKREVQNSNLPDNVKYEQVRGLQQQIVDLAKNGLASYENVAVYEHYATAGDRQFRVNKDGEWERISGDQLEKQGKVTKAFSIDPNEYWGNKEEYDYAYDNPEKYNFLKDNGISVSKYKDFDDDTKDAWSWAYNNPDKFTMSKAVTSDLAEYRKYASDLYDIRADKDKNGKTINGSAKAKKMAYIESLDIDYGAKLILHKSQYKSDDTYNRDIIEYLESRDDISWEEEKTILEELGFKVYSDGRITWD